MKRNLSVFLAAVFLICISAQGVLAQDTNWRIAEVDSDFVGRWEGSVIIPVHENLEMMMPESFINFTILLEYSKNQRNAGSNFRINLKIDVEKFLIDFLNMPAVIPYGFTLDSLWDILIGDIKTRMHFWGDGIGAQKYSISYNVSESVDEFYNNSSMGIILLNDDNNRMKLIFNEAIDAGFGDSSITEIILTKIG
jgi:hypothetical protein